MPRYLILQKGYRKGFMTRAVKQKGRITDWQMAYADLELYSQVFCFYSRWATCKSLQIAQVL